MTTRMVHPLHGATHAYDNSEIERLKGFGWAVEVPAVNRLMTTPEVLESLAPVVEHIREQVAHERKKPGPKPKAK